MTNACSGRGPALVLVANTRGARIISRDAITTGSVGIQVALDLSEEYSGLAVTVVFRAGEEQADWAVIGGEPVMVPPQCLQEPGMVLYIGVYARDGAGNKVIPTVWASAGAVRQGVEPSGYDPVGPAPSWAAQVQQAAAEAVETANSVRADADAGAFDGADGYSPTATVEQLADGATISITDKDGTTTATIHDGADGATGPEGPAGYSPSARVTQTASGATITVTDQSGTTTADISNGAPGEPGQTGPIGPTGEDGFSPTVDVQPITGGHEVTITDADGAHSFDVMDGDPAEPGSITDEMLAPDGIKPQVAQLWGNQLTGELSGTIDTASDAYAAPPMALTVEGASTQVTTTGKNLISDVAADWMLATLDGTSYRCTFVPVDAGASYLYHRVSGSTSLAAGWVDDTDGTGFVAIASMSGHNAGYTFTNSDSHSYLVFYFASSATAEAAAEAMSGGKVQVEAGTSYSGYEVYTGRAASPSPDWPQPILSVDDLSAYFCGKNMLPLYNTDFTSYGLTFTFDSEGKYTVSGNSTSTRVLHFFDFPETTRWPVGSYVLLTDPSASGGDTKGPQLGIKKPDGTTKAVRRGSARYVSFTIEEGERPSYYGFSIYNNGNYSGSTFLPMVVPAGTDLTFEPYTGANVPDLLPEGTSLRSLPDGTRDQLNLAYLRPSTRAGWAWYSRSVVQAVGMTTTAATDGITGTVGVDVMSTTGEIADGPTVLYKLATPVTTTLDPIELPELPAPNATVWCDGGSAQPSYTMEYVKDTNIVIAEMQAALADLATS